uniref:Uncharacterized protein n=1 Tax=Nelumbo nucifera TaxID=4432 RepID=A0A822XQX5_NELNU|nr:TPA_asm: hypothetical protein HUJ06_025467 [Nelumbo nucifera]
MTRTNREMVQIFFSNFSQNTVALPNFFLKLNFVASPLNCLSMSSDFSVLIDDEL